LRNESNTPDSPITMKGTIRHQNVSRMRPGTMSRAKPIVMPMPARIEAPITGRI